MVEFYDIKTIALHNPDFFKEQYLLADLERQERINACKKQEEKIRSLGGAMILRAGLQEYLLKRKRPFLNRFMTYGYGENGKPYFSRIPKLLFNISHSGEYVVGVFSDKEVGIDIQEIKPVENAIALRFFTTMEQKSLDMKEPIDRDRAFFKIWAAKESYMKYTGKGMKLSMKNFNIDLDNMLVLGEEMKTMAFLYEINVDENYCCMLCTSEEIKGIHRNILLNQ